MTLYEVDQRILAMTDPETGEIMDDAAFDALMMDRRDLIENMTLWYKDLRADVKEIKDEIDQLSARKQAMERKMDRIYQYLKRTLDGEKFSTARCAISYRSSTALDVSDIQTAAEWLENNGCRDMVTYEAKLDKRSIASLLKDGKSIPGVELENRVSMQLR